MNGFASFEFKEGDRVRVKEGPFEEKVGRVVAILTENGQIRIEIEMFGRRTPIDLEPQYIEPV